VVEDKPRRPSRAQRHLMPVEVLLRRRGRQRQHRHLHHSKGRRWRVDRVQAGGSISAIGGLMPVRDALRRQYERSRVLVDQSHRRPGSMERDLDQRHLRRALGYLVRVCLALRHGRRRWLRGYVHDPHRRNRGLENPTDRAGAEPLRCFMSDGRVLCRGRGSRKSRVLDRSHRRRDGLAGHPIARQAFPRSDLLPESWVLRSGRRTHRRRIQTSDGRSFCLGRKASRYRWTGRHLMPLAIALRSGQQHRPGGNRHPIAAQHEDHP
jgi:hypothetical protein